MSYDDDYYACDPSFECCESAWNPWDGMGVMMPLFTWCFGGSILASIISHIATLWLPRPSGYRRTITTGKYMGFVGSTRVTVNLQVQEHPTRFGGRRTVTATNADFGVREKSECEDCCECCESDCYKCCTCDDDGCFNSCCNNCFGQCFNKGCCNDCCGNMCYDCCCHCFCNAFCDTEHAYSITTTGAAGGLSNVKRIVALPDTVLGPAGFYTLPRYAEAGWLGFDIGKHGYFSIVPGRGATGAYPMKRMDAPAGASAEPAPAVVTSEPLPAYDASADMPDDGEAPAEPRRDYNPLYMYVTRLSCMVAWLLLAALFAGWIAATSKLWDLRGEDNTYNVVTGGFMAGALFFVWLYLFSMRPGGSYADEWCHIARLAVVTVGILMCVSAAYATRDMVSLELANYSNCGPNVCEPGECGCFLKVGHNGVCTDEEMESHPNICYSAALDDFPECHSLKDDVLGLLWWQSVLSNFMVGVLVALFDFLVLPKHFTEDWGDCCDKCCSCCDGKGCQSVCWTTIAWQIVGWSVWNQRRVVPAVITHAMAVRHVWVPAGLLEAMALPFGISRRQMPVYGPAGGAGVVPGEFHL